MEITEYSIVSSSLAYETPQHELSRQVRNWIADGWQPYGQPYTDDK